MKNTPAVARILEGYHFDLPEELLAKKPLEQRDDARMLVVHCDWKNNPHPDCKITHSHVKDLAQYLDPNDLVVNNQTRVSHRRVRLKRQSGARIEALFLTHSLDDPSLWYCIMRGKKKLKPDECLVLEKNGGSGPHFQLSSDQYIEESGNGANASLRAIHPESKAPAWKSARDAELFFQSHGEIPIPPYFGRSADDQDIRRYQTVFAQTPGSVAAPTAGLHFTNELFTKLAAKKIQTLSIDLEIGYGTFAPLQAEQFIQKKLHTENYSISEPVSQALNQADSRIIAIGTTTLRALESNWRDNQNSQFRAGKFQTDIFITPPDKPGSIDGLLTNFHLPGSSLLMLVASMLGQANTLNVYNKAIAAQYRFYSYGDAMLILP